MLLQSLSSNIKTFFHPYYFFNLLLSISFIVAKKVQPLCEFMFSSPNFCEITTWESEIFFFLLVIVMFRTRRSGNRNFLGYISTFSMYAKTCNILLWASADPIKGLIYAILVLINFLVVGEPVYEGPENIVYFDSTGPNEEFNRDKNCYWLITFYASWSPPCGTFASVFSKLSLQYGNKPGLKFGKIDVGRFPKMAKDFHINDSSFSVQLPTLALFKGGKELMRKPCLDSRGKFQKFYFTEDNVKMTFDLNNIYAEVVEREKKKSTSRAKIE